MPEPVGSSWADEIEEGDSSTLPPPSKKVKGDTKIVTEYMFNEDGKKVKVVRTYEIERKMVPKFVATFGMFKSDKPGSNPQVMIMRWKYPKYFIWNISDNCGYWGDLDEFRC